MIDEQTLCKCLERINETLYRKKSVRESVQG